MFCKGYGLSRVNWYNKWWFCWMVFAGLFFFIQIFLKWDAEKKNSWENIIENKEIKLFSFYGFVNKIQQKKISKKKIIIKKICQKNKNQKEIIKVKKKLNNKKIIQLKKKCQKNSDQKKFHHRKLYSKLVSRKTLRNFFHFQKKFSEKFS